MMVEDERRMPTFGWHRDLPRSVTARKWWRRPESNRCPNIFFESFLHAYSVLLFSGINWEQTTDQFLSCMSLLLPAQPMITASCFVVDWAEERATGLPSHSAIMTT